MRFLVLVTLSASFAAASAQDPKSEIIERVVDRCNLSTLAFERYSRNISTSPSPNSIQWLPSCANPNTRGGSSKT